MRSERALFGSPAMTPFLRYNRKWLVTALGLRKPNCAAISWIVGIRPRSWWNRCRKSTTCCCRRVKAFILLLYTVVCRSRLSTPNGKRNLGQAAKPNRSLISDASKASDSRSNKDATRSAATLSIWLN